MLRILPRPILKKKKILNINKDGKLEERITIVAWWPPPLVY